MKTEAPNIRGNYPLGGERIGPAWRALWAQLSETDWTDGANVSREVALADGLAVETVINLLRAARREGLLEVRMKPASSGRQRGEYRVIV